MAFDDLVPDTAAARNAARVCAAFHTTAMAHHCRRSYLWSVLHARRRGIAYDAELLYVAAMVHDLGLVVAFDSVSLPFEEAGGAVGWVFAAGAGWPAERCERVREVVIRHMWPAVDVAADPEGHLLELGTGLDISGRAADSWPAAERAGVLAAYPRLGLADEFARCFADQARRKPSSLAGQFVASGFEARARANPLDALRE